MAFEICDHTADIGISVSSGTCEEAFSEGVSALMQVMGPLERSQKKHMTKRLSVKANDLTELFVAVLNEVLFVAESRKVFVSVDRVVVDGHSCVIDIVCADVSGFTRSIKAVTFHQSNLSQEGKNQWKATVILDV